jgi:O-methyltransferase
MEFERFYNAILQHTLLDKARALSLWKLQKCLNQQNIAGDVVECGSYKGGSSAILRAAMGDNRKLWIYDSFEGMPATTSRDGTEASNYVGSCRASEQDVLEILNLTGAAKDEYVITKGWFQDSFKKVLPRKVALLHVDADWYDSVTLVLKTFYDLISSGGCVILDDFGYWEGCREAFYDFCADHNEKPLLERVGSSQAFWFKGRTNNRTGVLP